MLIQKKIMLPLLLLLLAGCVNKDIGTEPEDSFADELAIALEQAVDHSVLAAVEAFALEAAVLSDISEDYCGLLNESNLSVLQQQWRSLFSQWYKLSIYNFGPLNDDIVFPPYTFIDSLRLRGSNYLETVRSDIAADITGVDTLDDDYFAAKTFNKVGLLALESAIFETSTAEYSQAGADIIAEYQLQPRKCEVLRGLAAKIVERADYVQAGWLLAHKNSNNPYRTLFLNNQLDDSSKPMTQLVVAVQEFLDYLQARDVVNTAAVVSGYAWEAIAATIDEVESLLQGQAQGSDETSSSLFDLMIASGNQNAVDSVKGSIAQVRSAIISEDAAMLEIALGYLDGNFKREIPDSLEVELGINFSDGD